MLKQAVQNNLLLLIFIFRWKKGITADELFSSAVRYFI